MSSDLPYRAEYSKSGRASCRGCKGPIDKDVLRLAVMVQSRMFDGKTPNWYHFSCFFKKQRPKSADDIQYLENLRIEDQKKILDQIANVATIIQPEPKGKGKGKKRDTAAKKAALQDFKIEYAKSGRAGCRGCEQKIMKDEIRISKKDYQTEIGVKYGGEDRWHHLTCFAQLRSELGYFESADKLPGFKTLNKEDQAEAKKQLPAIKVEDAPEIKKIKTEDVVDGLTKEERGLYEEQIKLMYKNRDNLKTMKKDELIELLEKNKQIVPSGSDRILDRLADIMTFGALTPCELCKNGQLVFDKYGYKCRGNLTEWTKCNGEVKVPQRKPFKIPKHLTEKYDFLKNYKYVQRDRVIKPNLNESNGVKKEEKMEVDAEPKVKRDLPPLYNMEFVILGKLNRDKDEIKKQISKFGGKVVTKITENIMAVISTQDEIDKMTSRMSTVQEKKIQVVPEDFLDEVPNYSGKIPELVMKKSLVDWGSDPNTRLPPEPSTSTKSKSRSIYTSSMPSKQTLKLKGGGAVDPESGLEDVAHVYKDDKDKYTVVLGKTDIQTKQNSYYKIQLLKSDKKDKFWIFRSWGRIGTIIGSNKLESFDNLLEAKRTFTSLFEEKTGNPWELRDQFVKVPNGYYPMDIDYGEDDAVEKLDITDAPSKLPKPVQDLIHLIFDVQSMKKVMLEFELDTEKMPLGKISKKQILEAFNVLNELQQLIEKSAPEVQLIDASNRFYTFIPHSFGIDEPPILKDTETIKKKLDMLDNLMELEIAYNLMKSSGSSHTVDSYYQQLNTEIDVLPRDSKEFELIQQYVKNTHAETHRDYELEVVEVFTIKRQGEDKRFKPFKKLPNHKLLWHGSRITNYAGILSQGLRIAPPEAPVTGYMFGKGIYFADMVSKSANYCCTTPSNSTGLLLLCDVALGNIYERTEAEYIQKLPKGKHSTKGVGRTEPNPKESKEIDGIEVPLGKGVVRKNVNSALLYNEYIVYDVAQVRVKYLVRVDFKYKYGLH